MSTCPGSHCPGCPGCGGGPGGIILVIAAAVVFTGAVEWLLARIWWVLGGSAIIATVICWAAWRLLRWADRREARRGAELYAGRLVRSQVAPPRAAAITCEARPAIEAPRIRLPPAPGEVPAAITISSTITEEE